MQDSSSPPRSVDQQLIARAWQDADFKARLVTDPKAVLSEYGQIVPAHFDIKVLEETGNTRYFVLPTDPTASLDDMLLSENELDAIAGGTEMEAAEWCSVIYCSFQTR
jgi:Nitrile hydratase, alpha chain